MHLELEPGTLKSDPMNHVLIVDDESEIRDSLEGILSEEGYLVTSAATAGEALTLLADAPYDVVLLDIWLPTATVSTRWPTSARWTPCICPRSSSSRPWDDRSRCARH